MSVAGRVERVTPLTMDTTVVTGDIKISHTSRVQTTRVGPFSPLVTNSDDTAD